MAESPRSPSLPPPVGGDRQRRTARADEAASNAKRDRLSVPLTVPLAVPLAGSGGTALDELRAPFQRGRTQPWRVVAWLIIASAAVVVGIWIWLILRTAAERLDDLNCAHQAAMAVMSLAAQQPEAPTVSAAQLVDQSSWLALAERGHRRGIAGPHYRILGGRIEAQRLLIVGNPELWDGAGAAVAFGDGHVEWLSGAGVARLWQAAQVAPATTAWPTARIAALLKEAPAHQPDR